MEERKTILIVEDDDRLAGMIKSYLEKNNYHVVWERRGDRAEEQVKQCLPHLVILDLMLPGMDGFSICRRLRPEYAGPIIILTAKGDETDHVVGLELGADDYLSKPVSPRVLLAHVTALLRRCAAAPGIPEESAPSLVQFGCLTIDTSARAVFLDDEPVELTTNEYDLLLILTARQGEVLSRDALFSELRGIEYDGLDRSIDVYVSKLRKKLGDNPQRPFRIKTVWGEGYLFVKDAW